MPRRKWVLKSLMLDYRNGPCKKIPTYFPRERVSVSHRVSKTVKHSTIFFVRNYPISTVLNVESFFKVILLIYRFKMIASQIDKTILANGIV